MSDPTSELPGGSSRHARRRSRQDRNKRRKRLALVLVLLATLVGAAVFGPDFVRLVRRSQPNPHLTQRPVKTQRPVVRHQWRFDFSMGPILELIEQGLNLEPFDLRRPLRIPFSVRSRPGTDILLAGPASYLPPLVTSNGNPLGDLPPGGFGGRSPSLPDLPGLNGGGGGLPDGQPDFDPDLTIDDDPLAPPGTPPGDVPDAQSDEPPDVPEPGVLWLVGTGLAGLALRRSLRR
jgi:hypothetical protein